MKKSFFNLLIGVFAMLFLGCSKNQSSDNEQYQLSNPFTVDYLTSNLRKEHPRLVLNADIEKTLRSKLQSDPVVKNIYQAIRLNAESIFEKPFLERIKIGRRLLSVSREMLYRINMLGMVYRIEKDPRILERIDGEVKAVCQFSDWNPSHYLDVGEMSMAVAFALDWTAGDLPESTIEMALDALVEKGIKPSYGPESKSNTWWINGNNNWNQVCNGGMIAASIAIAEKDPELASMTLKRALDGLPHALDEYGPDGVYPEGSTYWGYGTVFSVVTNAMLESAFGTDFGLGDYPAFKESALFRVLMNAPSGWYYNFADCGDKRSQNGDITLAWFASKSGDEMYFERNRLLRNPQEIGTLRRLDGAGLVWLSQYEKQKQSPLPPAWKGEGANPIAVFSGGLSDPYTYYFGGKGGSGTVNHGNMDAGSFVFELNGIRWVVDPGNQSYHELEKTGFQLWGKEQDSQRWTLLNKNNYGHSTITVNDQLHVVDGKATIAEFKEGENAEVTFEMSPVFEGQLEAASRKFSRDSNTSLVIEDNITTAAITEKVTWQLITTAEVQITAAGAVLSQDGKSLKVENLSHANIAMNVVSLDPPPFELDRRIEGLKRLEINIPVSAAEEGKINIKVRLSGS
jgi:hypothetical protein